MNTDCTLHRLRASDIADLDTFLRGAGRSLTTFRYFARRPLEIVGSHLSTWLLKTEAGPVAYGHLEREADTVWLGLAVQEAWQQRGYGRRMLQQLLHAARGSGVTRLTLSVDRDNTRAIALYESAGFRLRDRGDRVAFYVCDVDPGCPCAVSSVAFGGVPAEGMLERGARLGLALEFSSGLPYRADMEAVFLDAESPRLAHNYFPAPRDPFVLNLASVDETIRQRSIDHCVRGITLSDAVGAPFFSAHAGFCVDPVPHSLGGRLDLSEVVDRGEAEDRFLAAIREVLDRTFDCAAGFLVENNVLTTGNHRRDTTPPLLGIDAPELLRLVRNVADPRFGLLADTGHLTVSANTLGFDRRAAALELLPHVRCIHHSDNDGLRDTNAAFDEGYWFMELMPRTRHAVHVLEVRVAEAEQLTGMKSLVEAS